MSSDESLTGQRCVRRRVYSSDGPNQTSPGEEGPTTCPTRTGAREACDCVWARWLREGFELGRRKGWDFTTMLRSAGMPASRRELCRITVEQPAHLLQALWRATDDELMGLGKTAVPRGTFALVLRVLVGAHDVRSALQRYSQVSRVLPGIPPVGLTVAPQEASVSVDLRSIDGPVEVIADALLIVCHHLIGWAIGHSPPLLRAKLPYPLPGGADAYSTLFDVPVSFSSDTATLIFDRTVLGAEIVRTPADLEHFVRAAPARFLTRHGHAVSTADQVRKILLEGASAGATPTMDDVARRLFMSPQTLRRRLRIENTSMREIRENLLTDTAIASLVRGEESVTSLSRRLGFSDTSAFTRAFRRWTGRTPTSYLPRS